jgi:hypothetical protein
MSPPFGFFFFSRASFFCPAIRHIHTCTPPHPLPWTAGRRQRAMCARRRRSPSYICQVLPSKKSIFPNRSTSTTVQSSETILTHIVYLTPLLLSLTTVTKDFLSNLVNEFFSLPKNQAAQRGPTPPALGTQAPVCVLTRTYPAFAHHPTPSKTVGPASNAHCAPVRHWLYSAYGNVLLPPAPKILSVRFLREQGGATQDFSPSLHLTTSFTKVALVTKKILGNLVKLSLPPQKNPLGRVPSIHSSASLAYPPPKSSPPHTCAYTPPHPLLWCVGGDACKHWHVQACSPPSYLLPFSFLPPFKFRPGRFQWRHRV